VTALGGTIAEARRGAYDAVARISFAGAQYRGDIALAAAQEHHVGS
jgi:phosphoribosylamine-glycine ligase